MTNHIDRGPSADDPNRPIRVAVADDQELMRSALRLMVESQDDLVLVGEASDGQAAVGLARTHRVDVMLMDVRMPHLDGIEATRRIVAHGPSTKVVVLTTFDLDAYVMGAIRAGASGFLLKDARAEDLIDAIHIVHAGHSVVAPSATRRLIERLARLPDTEHRDGALGKLKEKLTERELDVLTQIASGASNAEIASRLFLSEATVKTHIGHVLSKLRLRDRLQAAVLAYEVGLVRPGERSQPWG